jgi:hypothetical protein
MQTFFLPGTGPVGEVEVYLYLYIDNLYINMVICIYMYKYIHISRILWKNFSIYQYMYIYTHISGYIYIYIYIYVYIYIYIHIYSPNSVDRFPCCAMSLITSKPPTNTPPTYNWGKVGQSVIS